MIKKDYAKKQDKIPDDTVQNIVDVALAAAIFGFFIMLYSLI